MGKLYIYITLLSLGIFSCHSDRKGWNTKAEAIDSTGCVEIIVDPKKGEFIPFDSIIDKTSFVRLETNDSCLIGTISQVICTDSFIFIADREVAKMIFCFDRQGHFLRKIGNIGQGPGEYYGGLCYITLSPDKKHLVVVDWGKVIHYDFFGKFIKEIQIPNGIPQTDLEYVSDQILAGYSSSGDTHIEGSPMLSIVSNKWQKIYSQFPTYRRENFILAPVFPLQKFGDNVYFNKPYSEQFYEVGEKGLKEVYRLKIIDGGAPPITDDINDRIYAEQLKNVITCASFIILKDVAVFHFNCEGMSSPFLVYSTKTAQTYKCNMGFTNPLFYFYGIPIARSKDKDLVVNRTANYLLDYKKDLYNNPKVNDEILHQLYDGLTEDSNPVLFFYHVKI